MITKNTPKVYGTRICKNCNGICHTRSFRRNIGERKVYYCSENCLRNAITKDIQKSMKKRSVKSWMDFYFTDEEWIDFRNQFYERVFVITK